MIRDDNEWSKTEFTIQNSENMTTTFPNEPIQLFQLQGIIEIKALSV